MLFTTPDLGNYISGAILYEETLFQNHADGTPFVDCLKKIGVIPGIKVDTGLSPLPGGHEVETWCSGLDGLVERAKKYYAQGARFAKWRAVLQITSDGAPSNLSIQVSVCFSCGGRFVGKRSVCRCAVLRTCDRSIELNDVVSRYVQYVRTCVLFCAVGSLCYQKQGGGFRVEWTFVTDPSHSGHCFSRHDVSAKSRLLVTL